MWLSFLTVLGLGIVELWLAVPAGFLMGLHPVLTALAAIAGQIIAVLLIYKLASALRNWIIHRYFGDARERLKNSHLYRIWLRYGVVGLGLLAPLITGAAVATALGVAFDAPKRKLLFWIVIGVVLWAIGLMLAASLGILIFEEVVA